jgi:hypothetical protein
MVKKWSAEHPLLSDCVKKSAREIFVHCGAGIIRPRRALWINSFQPKYSAQRNFAAFKTTDFFNTIGGKRTLAAVPQSMQSCVGNPFCRTVMQPTRVRA